MKQSLILLQGRRWTLQEGDGMPRNKYKLLRFEGFFLCFPSGRGSVASVTTQLGQYYTSYFPIYTTNLAAELFWYENFDKM